MWIIVCWYERSVAREVPNAQFNVCQYNRRDCQFRTVGFISSVLFFRLWVHAIFSIVNPIYIHVLDALLGFVFCCLAWLLAVLLVHLPSLFTTCSQIRHFISITARPHFAICENILKLSNDMLIIEN